MSQYLCHERATFTNLGLKQPPWASLKASHQKSQHKIDILMEPTQGLYMQLRFQLSAALVLSQYGERESILIQHTVNLTGDTAF